jgi:catechol 2,3-dioxygenase-like lactoylglutathione lyase family enzyme
MTGKIGNITFDCENPRELSHFWADVLGYPRAEWPAEMKADLLAQDLTELDLEQRSIAEDPTGVGQRLFFQKVPEGKTVKNRVHLDINAVTTGRPTPEQVDTEKDRIVALGATVSHKYEATWGPVHEYFYVMHDPEGNEFCIH